LKLLSVNAKIGRVAYAGLDEARVLLASTAAMPAVGPRRRIDNAFEGAKHGQKASSITRRGIGVRNSRRWVRANGPRQRDLNAEAMREMSWWGDFAR
jgi:hypothetical protein